MDRRADLEVGISSDGEIALKVPHMGTQEGFFVLSAEQCRELGAALFRIAQMKDSLDADERRASLVGQN